jgi:hypothetical protein
MPGPAVPPAFLRATPSWSASDRWGAIRCRMGRFRMSYSVAPGLWAVGRPGPGSPVLVTASYKLSFDLLRRALGGPEALDAWVLVLDTKGINVWCAAGAGTFSTEELVLRVQASRLAGLVTHRTLVLPRLAAPGVSARAVEARTGFAVRWGPVRAGDIPAFLRAGETPGMGRVGFGIADRLVLVPIELGQSLLRFPAFLLAAFVLSGVTPGGVVFRSAWEGSWPLALLGVLSIVSGSALVPVLLPFLPFRSFALKGLLAGAAVTAAALHGVGLAAGMPPFLLAACWVFFPAASSAMALAFTGATPFTSPTGVRAELRIAIPLFVAAAALTLAALVLWKLGQWGLLP